MRTRQGISHTLLLSVFFCSASANAFSFSDTIRSQPKPPKKVRDNFTEQPMIIKTSPTAFLWGGIFPLTAEYRFMVEMTGNRKQSDQLGISYLGKNIGWLIWEKTANQRNYIFKVNGYRIQYAHKFYLVTKRGYAPYGFYFGPMISYSNAKVSIGLKTHYRNVYYDFQNLNLNVIIGVQTGKRRKRATDIYFGLGYKQNKVDFHYMNGSTIDIDTEDFGPLYNSNINAVFGINIGIRK